MPNMRWAEKEEEQLDKDLAEGLITRAESHKAMAELQREIRNAFEEEREERHREVDRDYDGGW
jgi:hypothetical protein